MQASPARLVWTRQPNFFGCGNHQRRQLAGDEGRKMLAQGRNYRIGDADDTARAPIWCPGRGMAPPVPPPAIRIPARQPVTNQMLSS
jgi:hypothetical protein